MPAGVGYHVEATREGDDVFLHRAVAASIVGNSSRLSHPTLDGNAKANIQCTSLWNPDSASGIYNPHAIGVCWDGAGWAVTNVDLAPMPEGASFIVAVVPDSA